MYAFSYTSMVRSPGNGDIIFQFFSVNERSSSPKKDLGFDDLVRKIDNSLA